MPYSKVTGTKAARELEGLLSQCAGWVFAVPHRGQGRKCGGWSLSHLELEAGSGRAGIASPWWWV
jgi:hypothetical protein